MASKSANKKQHGFDYGQHGFAAGKKSQKHSDISSLQSESKIEFMEFKAVMLATGRSRNPGSCHGCWILLNGKPSRWLWDVVGRFEVQPACWFDVFWFSRPFFWGDGLTPPTSEALHWRYLTFQVHVRHIQKEPWPHTHVTICAMVRKKRRYLVGGLEHVLFFHLLGMSSSQLTNSYVSEAYPPVNVYITMENHNVEWDNSLFLWPVSIANHKLPEG